MRNCVLVVCLLVSCITLSAAQGKISSQWKCNKPSDQHSIAVPDLEDHSYSIAQGKCTSEKGGMGNDKEQEGTYNEFDETIGGTAQVHGVFVVILASGDKVFYRYHGTRTLKGGSLESGADKWALASGTGKYTAATGQGTCNGNGNPDGSSTWNCEGSYSGAK